MEVRLGFNLHSCQSLLIWTKCNYCRYCWMMLITVLNFSFNGIFQLLFFFWFRKMLKYFYYFFEKNTLRNFRRYETFHSHYDKISTCSSKNFFSIMLKFTTGSPSKAQKVFHTSVLYINRFSSRTNLLLLLSLEQMNGNRSITLLLKFLLVHETIMQKILLIY